MSNHQKIPGNETQNTADDEQWVAQNLQEHLDSKVETLDFNVTSKLSAARRRALASEQTSSTSDGFSNKLFKSQALVGGVAVMVLTVFLGSQLMPQQVAPTIEQASELTHTSLIEDMTMLSSSEDIEFFEAIEFLEWMESNAG